MVRPEERFAAWMRFGAVAAAFAASAIPASAQQPEGAPAQPNGDAPAPAGDAPGPVLVGEERTVFLEADEVRQIKQNGGDVIVAQGDVQARFQGRTLRADKLAYVLDTGIITAEGSVEMAEADGAISYYDKLQLDEAMEVGVATNLRARLKENATLAARAAYRRGLGRNELSHIVYTSCRVCEGADRPPTWALRARSAVQDQEARQIAYRNATLEVAGVPVFYLPYFSHPDPSGGPQSGFLPPDIGRNRRLGTYYEQPYYWRISPHSDVTVSARLHSHVHPLFGVDYRKRFWSGDLAFDASLTNEQDFDSNGDTFGDEAVRGHIFGQGRFRISNFWKWGFGLERSSDDLYLRRYGISGAGQERGPYIGDQARLISQVYAAGQNEDSYAFASIVSFQGLRATDSSDLTPLILPSAEYQRVFEDPWLDGQLRWTSNAAVLARESGRVNGRVSSGVSWRKDYIVGPGLQVSPFAMGRVDGFYVDPEIGDEESFTRTVGLAGAEVSWPLLRPGENVDIIVEPVVMAALGSEGGDDERIVNEDSLNFEIDDSNLFRPNAAPNYDLWEPGERGAVGVRATAEARTGESAQFFFGRRFRADPAPIFTALNNLEDEASDYVASGEVDLGRQFGAIVRARFDDRNLDVQRIDTEVRASLWRVDAYGRYFSVDDSLNPGNPSQELTSSVSVQLLRGWRVQFANRRDLDSDINLRQELRAIYTDDCTFLELAYTRSETVDRRLGPNEGFQIRVGLRTLGVIGGGD
jgi:LPS-assembly protein